jgi:hypothetical protein
LYFEKHTIMENFLTLRYDTRQSNKMLDLVFERKWYFLDLDELYEQANIKQEDRVVINKINIGDEVYWFLILWRESRTFSGSDKKIFISVANSLAWILKKFFADKESRDRLYIRETKNL